ncbi:MAG: hypothetical protein K9H64_17755 [Bacteroidales bacterium]|nr:hypothetical protein [Bacteroidales bacterium]MCF8457825.1 hypothetical protein [Bacteroidales bacterium]
MIAWIISWLIFSIVIGIVGANKKIGFAGSFFLSILLSPLIGLIFTLTSKSLEAERYEHELLKTQKLQQKTLQDISKSSNDSSITAELTKLIEFQKKGILIESEFLLAKQRLLERISETGIDNSHENKSIIGETSLERATRIGSLNEKEKSEIKKFIDYGIKKNERLIINKISRKIDRVDEEEWYEIERKFENENWLVLLESK